MDPEYKIFLFGLDNAGKSTILKFIKEGVVAEDIPPTKKFNVIDIILEELKAFVWDAPGQIKYRKSWADNVVNTSVLIYIVDTAAKTRYREAKEELERILSLPELRKVHLIVCFHKIDLEEAKEHIYDARTVLDVESIKERNVNWLKTSLYESKTVEDLRLLLYLSILRVEKQKALRSLDIEIADLQKKQV